MSLRKPLRAQAAAEFAVVAPVLILLIAAIFLGWLYVWRGAAVDLGLFYGAIGASSYSGPKDRASQVIPFQDLRDAVKTSRRGTRAEARVRVVHQGPGPWGLVWVERHFGKVTFYLWKFYPGPEP